MLSTLPLMKLLAVFGLALAVAAIDMPTSGYLKQPIHGPQSHLERLKENPNNSDYCLDVLLMVYNNRISLAAHPEVAFPLVRYCLETDSPLVPEKLVPGNLLEMDVVHVAAFIFMFRVQGKEKAAECLYNAAMQKHFPEKFNAGLHNEPYPPNPLQVFKGLRTLDSFEEATYKMPLLSGLEADRERQFFMLWTVRMYGRGLEGMKAYERLLEDADQVVLTLASMGIPLEVLVAGLIALQKELPVGIAPDSLPSLLLMLFSLNRDWYSRLRKPEKTQLRAFLERYLILKLRGLDLLAKTLSAEGLEQLGEAFKSEAEFRCGLLNPGTITKFAMYFRKATLAGCPAFLLKRMFDFYLENSSFKTEAMLDGKRYFLAALISAFGTVERDWRYGKVEEDKEFSDKGLVCSQMEDTISECDWEISRLRLAFAKENPAAKDKWKEGFLAEKGWNTFQEMLDALVAMLPSSLRLSN